jgi:hypothetical protein
VSSNFAKSKILCASTVITLLGVQFAAAQAMGPPPGMGPPSGMGPPPDIAVPAALPGYQVLAAARSAGFEPLGRPFLRGRIYWLRAIGRRGQDVALTIDAASGRILAVAPAGPPVRYGGVAEYDPPGPPGPYGRDYDAPAYGPRPYAYGPPPYGPPPGYGPNGYGPPAYGPSSTQPPGPQAPQAYRSPPYGSRGPDVGDDDDQSMPTGTTTPPLPSRTTMVTPPRTPLPRPRPQDATIASSTDTAAPAPVQNAPTPAIVPAPNDKKDGDRDAPAVQQALPPETPLD